MKQKKAEKEERTAKFEQLLVNWKGTRFSEFAARFARDPRFLVIDKMRERETLFFNYKKKASKMKDNEDKRMKEEIQNSFRWNNCIGSNR